MKIIGFIDSLGSGGAQRQMVLLLRGLAERGHDVSIANYYPHLNHFRSELNEVCSVIDLSKKSRWSVAPALSLRKILKQSNPDILLSFLDTPNVYAVLASIGISFTKTIVSERFSFGDEGPSFMEKSRYFVYRGADAITTNSEHQKKSIQKYFPNLSRKISRIYNGVDLDRFSPAPISDNIISHPLRLLAVASIVAKKNPVKLMEALAHARERGLDVEVDWVGKKCFSEEGIRVFEECQSIRANFGLAGEWRWLGERHDVAELMRSYDALIHPSFREGFPNVICEALASGMPVLASNVGDHSNLVEHGVNGFLFNPEDEASIFEAISALYHLEAEDIITMRDASRSFAELQLDGKKLAENYENLFLELI